MSWVREAVERLREVEEVQKRLGMVSRIGPPSQLTAEATEMGPNGSVQIAVVDGETVVGEENSLRAAVMMVLRLMKVDVDSPQRFIRIRRKRKPMIIGGDGSTITTGGER